MSCQIILCVTSYVMLYLMKCHICYVIYYGISNVMSSLYKFSSWLLDCPFVGLSVCPFACLSVTFYLSRCVQICPSHFLCQIKSKLHQTFSMCDVWSPKLFKIVWDLAHTCMHAQRVKMCTLLLWPFLGQFFNFWGTSWLKFKKTEATL